MQKIYWVGALLVAGLCGCEDNKSEKPAAAEPTQAKTQAPPPEPPPDPNRNDYKPPTVEGSVAFEGLKDGAKIKGKNIMGMVAAELNFKVEGMSVAEEGPVEVNTGHFVVLVDADAVPEKKEPPSEGRVYRYGKGEKTGTVPLTEGKHKLTLQFVDARDRSYGEKWSASLNVTAASE